MSTAGVARNGRTEERKEAGHSRIWQAQPGPKSWRVQRQQMSIDVEGEFDESSMNEAADRAVRLIAVHLSGKRELIDDPLPGSVVLAASDFGGDGAVRESR